MRFVLPPLPWTSIVLIRWSSSLVITLGCAAVKIHASTASDDTAAKLGYRYDPSRHAAKAKPGDPRTEAEDPVPAGVIRLPRHVVTESRIQTDDDALLTPEGRVEVAKKRHLSPLYRVTLGPLAALASLLNNPLGGWNPNGPEAMALYEQERKRVRDARITELEGLARLAEEARAYETGASRKPSKAEKR